MLLILFPGNEQNMYLYQSITVQVGLLRGGWKQNNPLSIDIEVKRKKRYCCNDVTNNIRGSIPPNIYRMEGYRFKLRHAVSTDICHLT